MGLVVTGFSAGHSDKFMSGMSHLENYMRVDPGKGTRIHGRTVGPRGRPKVLLPKKSYTTSRCHFRIIIRCFSCY